MIDPVTSQSAHSEAQAQPNSMHSSPMVLSEQMANALREGRLGNVAQAAPLLACTYRMMEHLGWTDIERHLIEALPHFSERLGAQECRNIWVELGYSSTPIHGACSQRSSELLPYIFVSKAGRCYVVFEKLPKDSSKQSEVRFRVYNASKNRVEEVSDGWLGEGVAYLFNDIAKNRGLDTKPTGGWFKRLALRFKPQISYLVGISFVLNGIALTVPFFIMAVYDTVIGAESEQALPFLLAGILVVMGFDLVLRWIRGRVLGRVAGRIDYLVGIEAYKKVISLAPLLTERSNVTSQLARLKQLDSVREFFTGATAATLLDVPFIPVFLVVLAVVADWLALVPVAVALVFFVMSKVRSSADESYVSRTMGARAAQQRFQSQSLDGRNEISACEAQQVWIDQYRRVSADSAQANFDASSNATRASAMAQAVVAFANIVVLVVGILMIISEHLSIGALIAVMLICGKVLGVFQQLFLNETRIRQTLSSIRQIDQLMSLDSEQSVRAEPKPSDQIKGLVQLDKVSFRYAPQEDPALLGVSLMALPGQLVVIAGETGSGKSSLVKLMAGMYRPQSGTVTLDQLDVRQLGGKSLRRSVAYVPQDAQLFFGSLAQNIRMNNPMATDHDLEQAARMAGVLPAIQALPQGFYTQVGDAKTDRLTPGFVRGVGLARALVSEAQVILLDEPASHLDRFSDQNLRQQLQRLKGQRTVILTSHRPSHIAMADHVVIMDRGSVVFSGSPNDALERLKGGGRGR